jgi:hypothetical protein
MVDGFEVVSKWFYVTVNTVKTIKFNLNYLCLHLAVTCPPHSICIS